MIYLAFWFRVWLRVRNPFFFFFLIYRIHYFVTSLNPRTSVCFVLILLIFWYIFVFFSVNFFTYLFHFVIFSLSQVAVDNQTKSRVRKSALEWPDTSLDGKLQLTILWDTLCLYYIFPFLNSYFSFRSARSARNRDCQHPYGSRSGHES